MIYAIPAIFFFLLVYGPFLWVKYILWKFNKQIEGMPGTGSELANHFIDRFKLDGVIVEKGKTDDNHYDPGGRIVCLSPDVFDGKSLTSIAVATHEIGHAIQFAKNEPVTRLRNKYLTKAQTIKKHWYFYSNEHTVCWAYIQNSSLGLSYCRCWHINHACFCSNVCGSVT